MKRDMRCSRQFTFHVSRRQGDCHASQRGLAITYLQINIGCRLARSRASTALPSMASHIGL